MVYKNNYPLAHKRPYNWWALEPRGKIAFADLAASIANPKSFSIKAEPKPPLYSLFAGEVGVIPGAGL